MKQSVGSACLLPTIQSQGYHSKLIAYIYRHNVCDEEPECLACMTHDGLVSNAMRAGSVCSAEQLWCLQGYTAARAFLRGSDLPHDTLLQFIAMCWHK